MKITEGILELLKKKGKVTVPGFGIFFTENSRAVLNSDQKTILPPGKEIRFEADYHAENSELLDFLSSKGLTAAAHELKVQTDYWKNLLLKNDTFFIDRIGEFFVSENQLVFKGERIQTETPDFYGLEEINLSEINNITESTETQVQEPETGNYRFNTSILWIFLVGLPVIGLAYFGITQKERLFGKKTFDDITVKNSTHRIEKKQQTVTDSVKQKAIADSIAKDSLAKIAAVPVTTTKKWNSTKKWTSKKNTKKKWKPKKRQTP